MKNAGPGRRDQKKMPISQPCIRVRAETVSRDSTRLDSATRLQSAAERQARGYMHVGLGSKEAAVARARRPRGSRPPVGSAFSVPFPKAREGGIDEVSWRLQQQHLLVGNW